MAKRYVVCVRAGLFSTPKYYKHGGMGWTTDIKRAHKFDTISDANKRASKVRQEIKSDPYAPFLPELTVSIDPYIG